MPLAPMPPGVAYATGTCISREESGASGFSMLWVGLCRLPQVRKPLTMLLRRGAERAESVRATNRVYLAYSLSVATP